MDRRILPAAPGGITDGGASASPTQSGQGYLVGQPSNEDVSLQGTKGPGRSGGTAAKRRTKKDGEGDVVDVEEGTKKKKSKRRKVDHACVYCRRSHMTCDSGRPCQRCIKREIGHLCHDEVKPSPSAGTGGGPKDAQEPLVVASAASPGPPQDTFPPPTSNWPMVPQSGGFQYASQNSGNEFSVLTDFLQSLGDRSFFGAPPNILPAPAPPEIPLVASNHAVQQQQQQSNDLGQAQVQLAHLGPVTQQASPPQAQEQHEPASPILPAATKTEQFLLLAADQESGSRDERLKRVIHSKYEAGLLKPYNYVKGYARLSRWMDRNVSQESKQLILGPLSVLRPKFRAIAQSLTDIDLVFIEEAFERLLLDYDRVFSAMGIPACLWRRTGEIYKGNREFAELVGVEGHMLREGRLCIYELMAEESAVNYWEACSTKYGHVAFDTGQKAVLTSCVLRFKPNLTSIAGSNSVQNSPVALRPAYGQKRGQQQASSSTGAEQGLINCCFSFTIRRDTWGIPSMIVGNFIRH
ncbi:hypothetical protein K439DRAFT_1516623 [Ramaria rubella]|nr:hypothetical protein K439DRAFT_1516623 [Ramaria rubella]